MSTPADFPNSPSANQEFVAAGKSWTFIGSVWKRYTVILSDGGYAGIGYTYDAVNDVFVAQTQE